MNQPSITIGPIPTKRSGVRSTLARAGRYKVLVGAAELMEPEAQFVQLPSRTLKTPDDIDAWLDEVRRRLEQALEHGPIVIH